MPQPHLDYSYEVEDMAVCDHLLEFDARPRPLSCGAEAWFDLADDLADDMTEGFVDIDEIAIIDGAKEIGRWLRDDPAAESLRMSRTYAVANRAALIQHGVPLPALMEQCPEKALRFMRHFDDLTAIIVVMYSEFVRATDASSDAQEPSRVPESWTPDPLDFNEGQFMRSAGW